MARRSRLILTAAIVGLSVAAWALLRAQEAPPASSTASEPPRVAGVEPPPSAAALPSLAARPTPLSATPFDPAREASAPDDDRPPPPPHLRRVRVQVVFDDGTPLAGLEARAVAPESAHYDAPGWGDADAGAGEMTTLDAEGRAVVDVPKDRSFRMAGDGDFPMPPFLSAVATLDGDAARCVVPSRATTILVRDESGAPAPGVSLQGSGEGSGGSGYGIQTSDAEGRVVFRNMAGETFLAQLQDVESTTNGRRRRLVLVRWEGAATEYADGGERGFQVVVGGSSTATIRTLPYVDGRILGSDGAPVPHAHCRLLVDVGAPGAPRLVDGAMTDEGGGFSLAFPKDGESLAADAAVVGFQVVVKTPDDREETVYRRSGDPGAGVDAGDLVVQAVRWFEVQAVDERGPVDDFEIFRAPGATDAWYLRRGGFGEGAVALLCCGAAGERFSASSPRHLPTEFVVQETGGIHAPPRCTVTLRRGGSLTLAAPPGRRGSTTVEITAAEGSAVVDGSPGSRLHVLAEGATDTLEGLRPGTAFRMRTYGDADVVDPEARLQTPFPAPGEAVDIPPLAPGEMRAVVVPPPGRVWPVRIRCVGAAEGGAVGAVAQVVHSGITWSVGL
ncbi:MAG TPA: hypothetical protein VEI02_09700, partial [Planctomycetota bacterium]|nr:hypothetical protein [Planctomycetota bacterium]